MRKLKQNETVLFVHNSLMGGSARISREFGCPSVLITNYYDSPDVKVILVARQRYRFESMVFETEFLNKYYKRIIGVIIVDDKNLGASYGADINQYHKLGLPIIAVIDRVLTDENRREIERWMNKNAY